MKVHVLRGAGRTYSCRSYLALGDWNRLCDVNTLIDAGGDASIVDEIDRISTGVGKRAVERVILTHGHFDHRGAIDELTRRWAPEVCAFAPAPGVTRVLRHGELLPVGDTTGCILHTPGHSADSVCLFVPSARTLFCGDTPLRIRSPGGVYGREFVRALEHLTTLPIELVYFGHDDPESPAMPMLLATLANVRASELVD